MLETFYSVIEKNIGKESAAFSVQFNAQHPIFQGHFPTMPVVPGACLMQMAGELFVVALQKNIHIVGAKNIKFLQVIYPNKTEVVTFDLSWEACDGGYEVKCSVVDAEKKYAAMQLTFAD